MKKHYSKNGFLPLAAMAAGLMEPVLQKKAGLNRRLIRNWAEIVGQPAAEAAVPVKIIWPRQADKAAGSGLAAAVLVIACFGYQAVQLQHETSELIARINRFFGYRAIGKIRIEQKLPPEPDSAAARALPAAAALPWAKTILAAPPAGPALLPDRLQADIAAIGDENLRASLQRLGQAVYRG